MAGLIRFQSFAFRSISGSVRKFLPRASPEAEEAQYGYYDDYCSYEPDKFMVALPMLSNARIAPARAHFDLTA
ncbi:hypothetical protein [Mesorhizobium sp.]|uniref:hypothetical protein n=1 Tax=Mesorhizobium sp. TaxID=1871066 RepID=UPI0025C4D0BD|nr:hypothetical protein [Mesorhizobium sp.]